MVKAQRMEKLREHIAQLEALPDSPQRNRLLAEFRSRVVDVDTGVPPRAILPMQEHVPAPRERPRSVTRKAAPAPVVEPAPTVVEEPFWATERLSLDDSPDDRATAPWTLGLRG